MQTLARLLHSFASFSLVAAVAGCSSSSPGSNAGGDAGATGQSLSEWFCPNATVQSCGMQLSVCGVCVPAPPSQNIQRTSGWREYSGTGDPDLSCFDQGSPALAPLDTANSKLVNMRGWVRIFANGPDSNNVKIEVFKEGVNGALGDKVGEANADGALTTFSDGAAAGTKTEQITGQAGGTITRTLYPYEVKSSVPTETPLIVRTTATGSAGWMPLYDYNIVARNSALVAPTNGATQSAFDYDVQALGNDDYGSILRAAYSRPPVGGQSAIAGEVHDCGDVRIKWATVGMWPRDPLGLFYLSDVEDNPLPSAGLTSTAGMGLYAAGGINPGPYTVAALGTWQGKTVSLGTYTVQTFPDSVTAISFRGLRPWQVPTK